MLSGAVRRKKLLFHYSLRFKALFLKQRENAFGLSVWWPVCTMQNFFWKRTTV